MPKTITTVEPHGATNRGYMAKQATCPTSDLCVGPTNISSGIPPTVYSSMTISITWKAITMKTTVIPVSLTISRSWFPSDFGLWSRCNIWFVLDFWSHLFFDLCRYGWSNCGAWWTFFSFFHYLVIAKIFLVKGRPLTLKDLIKNRGARFHMSFWLFCFLPQFHHFCF